MTILAVCCLVAVCIIIIAATNNVRHESRSIEALRQNVSRQSANFETLAVHVQAHKTELDDRLDKLEARVKKLEDMAPVVTVTTSGYVEYLKPDGTPESQLPEYTVTTTSSEAPDVEDMTRAQLMTILDQAGIPYRKKATRTQLIALVQEMA